MKNSILFYLLLLCATLPFSAFAQSSAIDTEKELEAIIQVIEAETQCFFERNYDCWKTAWVNEDYAFLAWNTSKGGYDSAVGWKAIDKMSGDYIKNNPVKDAKASHPTVKRKDINVKFYGANMAYLTYLQYNSHKTNTYFTPSQEVRIMEKVNGEWKIVQISAFWDYNTKIPMEEE